MIFVELLVVEVHHLEIVIGRARPWSLACLARKLSHTKFGPPRNFAANINYQCFLCTLIAFHLSTFIFNSLKPLRHTPGFFYDELLLYKVTNFYRIAKYDGIANFHSRKYKVVIIMLITLT